MTSVTKRKGLNQSTPEGLVKPRAKKALDTTTAFGCSRDFRGQYPYIVISPRARGLSLGINLNPNRFCNFDCVYCEVPRGELDHESAVDLDQMSAELQGALAQILSNQLTKEPLYSRIPAELLQLRQIAISGDGEPTLCPNFQEVIETLVHLRATRKIPKLDFVLFTNASGLHLSNVRAGIELLTDHDEIWAKLDTGTQSGLQEINRTDVPLETILANILDLARERPVVIQSLFTSVDGVGPTSDEISALGQRIKTLKSKGAKIPLVQVYSPTRPTHRNRCEHLPLGQLSDIAKEITRISGVTAEAF